MGDWADIIIHEAKGDPRAQAQALRNERNRTFERAAEIAAHAHRTGKNASVAEARIRAAKDKGS